MSSAAVRLRNQEVLSLCARFGCEAEVVGEARWRSFDPPWKESSKHHQVLDALRGSSDAAVEGKFSYYKSLGVVVFFWPLNNCDELGIKTHNSQTSIK